MAEARFDFLEGTPLRLREEEFCECDGDETDDNENAERHIEAKRAQHNGEDEANDKICHPDEERADAVAETAQPQRDNLRKHEPEQLGRGNFA